MIIIIKKKFIKLMHQKSVIVDIIHWCWKVFFHREDFNNISEFTQQDDKKRGRQNACVWQTWQAYDLRVLWWSSLKSMFSGLLQKDPFQRRVKFARNVFQTKLLSHLSHKVCRLLSSPVLSHKLTITRMWLCFYHYHSPLYPASRAFLSLAWFCCTHERLYYLFI